DRQVPAFTPGGKWVRCYVNAILRDRRAVGEYQPRRRDNSKDGDVIAGYYPAVVSEPEWGAARAGAKERRYGPDKGQYKGVAKERRERRAERGEPSHQKQTRRVNLFAGLLKDALDGSGYFVQMRQEKARNGRPGWQHDVLITYHAKDGRAGCRS